MFFADVNCDGDSPSDHGCGRHWLDGKTINLVCTKGGGVAGEKKSIDILITGGIVTYSDEDKVSFIEAKLAESQSLCDSFQQKMGYLRFCMIEAGI